MWWSFRVKWTHWNRNGEALWPRGLSASYFRMVFKERWLRGPQCRSLPSPSLPPLAFPPSPIPLPPLTFLGFFLLLLFSQNSSWLPRRLRLLGVWCHPAEGALGADLGMTMENSGRARRTAFFTKGWLCTIWVSRWPKGQLIDPPWIVWKKKNPACSLHKTLWRSPVSVLHSGGRCGELIV